MTTATAALGVFEGPAFVCRHANDQLRELAGFDPVGMPIGEACLGEAASHRAMTEALRSGVSVTHQAPAGMLRIRPLVDADALVWGVATCWIPIRRAGQRGTPG